MSRAPLIIRDLAWHEAVAFLIVTLTFPLAVVLVESFGAAQ